MIDKSHIKKIPTYKTKICVNWRKEFFYNELKNIKKTQDKDKYNKKIDDLLDKYTKNNNFNDGALKKQILEEKIKTIWEVFLLEIHYLFQMR